MDVTQYDKALALLRSRLYGLLSAGFRQVTSVHYEYLSGKYIADFKAAVDFIEEGRDQFLPLVTSLEEAIGHTYHEGLYQSYNELFMPFSEQYVSPYEMECIKETPAHSLTSQAELADVAGFYKAFGLDTAANMPERVDHIATQLEFMHFMALREAEAIEEGNPEHIQIVIDAEKKFMTDHLGRWAGVFAERIYQQRESGFYSYLARLLKTWIDTDLALIYEG